MLEYLKMSRSALQNTNEESKTKKEKNHNEKKVQNIFKFSVAMF